MAPVLTHLALHVRDFEACVDFYRDDCQLEEVHKRGAEAAGRLVWRPRDEPFPVGYYCGVRDPDGQPLGPGAGDLGAGPGS